MARCRGACALLLGLAALLAAARQAEAQFSRGMGEYLAMDVASDYMYRFRVPVTRPSLFAYGIIASQDRIGVFQVSTEGRGLMDPIWMSDRLPGLNVSQPVLSVDNSTDRVYFIRPMDGRLTAYDANATLPTADGSVPTDVAPLWVSDVVCSAPGDERQQHHQALTANGRRLLARCNDSVLLLSAASGRLLKTLAGPRVADWMAAADAAAPFAAYADFGRLITWPSSEDAAAPQLHVWDLASYKPKARNQVAPAHTIKLPAGVAVGGVGTSHKWLLVLADALKPVVHVVGAYNGKLLSSFDFAPLVNATLAPVMVNFTVVPTPVTWGNTVYGLIRGVVPSEFPWMPEQYPDEHYWWAFALDVSNAKAPSLLWLTEQQKTLGVISNQAPWVAGNAIFMSDFPQNATRSFDRFTGQPWFNVPAVYWDFNARNSYSLVRGTYKMSLPWAHPDGYTLVFQYDDWVYDQDPTSGESIGYIRILRGLITSPSPPPEPPSADAGSPPAETPTRGGLLG
ncbi:hypothetical protein HYH03_018654 [Edaphochlamys debaryana]|uniref:Uncharacterized protein n=1 Tax=Edaphochlamys debaryana TaxID=47281 RepID=A0A835XLH3_9CHLO|nr:hypothetical protein HYH03_018654 [Edaphochlamys debaryana]|eukprot:KAG2482419.1 hypothetical protein HYH03_018654 [Edaphochlamys debaryana]